MPMPAASVQKKPAHPQADVKLQEDVGSALVQLSQRLADAVSQAKPQFSHCSYIDYEKKSKWADGQLSGYKASLAKARMDLADAAQEIKRLCGLLGITETTKKVDPYLL